MHYASLLAADRSTKFLPVIVAQAIFIGSVAIAIIQTKQLANQDNPQTFIDVEMYSIGFTALYFWVITLVTFTSIIGTSQTAGAIPNLLKEFREKLSKEFPGRTINLPQNLNAEERYRLGGIYSWQPGGTIENTSENAVVIIQRPRTPTVAPIQPKWSTTVILTVSSLLIVSFGTSIGMILTSLVPPDGWTCRTNAEISILATWIVSYPLSLIPWGNHHRRRFWFTFFKDFVVMVATLGLISAVQIGIYNKCSCYTGNGGTGLALPQTWIVKTTLEYRLDTLYPALAAIGVGVQLVIFPGIVVTNYYEAVRVLLQRDDGKSNLQWYHNICSRTWWKKQARDFKVSRRTRPTEVSCEHGSIIHGEEILINRGDVEMDMMKDATVRVEKVSQ
jgi:hypothetical protein